MTPSVLQSPAGTEPVVLQSTFKTDAVRLFRAWTTPKEIKQWFGVGEKGPVSAIVDVQPGGEWKFTFTENEGVVETLSGRYVDVIANELLSFTWQHQKRLADGTVETTDTSLVTVRFTEVRDGTRLHLTHQHITKESGRLGVGRGWSASYEKLARFLNRVIDVCR